MTWQGLKFNWLPFSSQVVIDDGFQYLPLCVKIVNLIAIESSIAEKKTWLQDDLLSENRIIMWISEDYLFEI